MNPLPVTDTKLRSDAGSNTVRRAESSQNQAIASSASSSSVSAASAFGEVVAQHRKVPGRHKRAIVAEHYAGLPVVAAKARPAQAIQTPASTPDDLLAWPTLQVETRPLSIYGQLSEVHHD